MRESETALEMFESLRPEIASFCYRMLGSPDEADDAVQETRIRVWRRWDTFRGDSPVAFRTWVYRIASNLCLDKLRQARRRALPVDLSDPAAAIVQPRETLPASRWVWPVPDDAFDPEEIAIRRDTLRLCFIALLQTLPPRQRAVLILKDVFDWPSRQIAEALDMSTAAVNSALQRARTSVGRTALRSVGLSEGGSEPDRDLLARYVEAFERYDVEALVALFHEEGCMSMPPFVMWVRGRESLARFFPLVRWHCEGSRFLPVTVNGGHPALAHYVPDQSDPSVLIPWGIHVPEMKDGKIWHVQNFIDPDLRLFPRFGLPARLSR
ncbi:MAG: RNA polymerase subunit sigma-70 [Paenibacillaceae bacterium ZCTH02-B3]|nr:MAG: RNA polymerase subunit sigma-70 [Paenibacillaceae bacterium ZCTH02-B3]